MFMRLTEAEHHRLDARLLEFYRALKQHYNYGDAAAKAIAILDSVEGKLIDQNWRKDYTELKRVFPAYFVSSCPGELHPNYPVVSALYEAIRELVIFVCDRKASESPFGLPTRLIDALAHYLWLRDYQLVDCQSDAQENPINPSSEDTQPKRGRKPAHDPERDRSFALDWQRERQTTLISFKHFCRSRGISVKEGRRILDRARKSS